MEALRSEMRDSRAGRFSGKRDNTSTQEWSSALWGLSFAYNSTNNLPVKVNFPPELTFEGCKFSPFAYRTNGRDSSLIIFDPKLTQTTDLNGTNWGKALFFCELRASSGSNRHELMSLSAPCTFKELKQNTVTTAEAIRVGREEDGQIHWATLIGCTMNRTRAMHAKQDASISFSSPPPNVDLLVIDCMSRFSFLIQAKKTRSFF